MAPEPPASRGDEPAEAFATNTEPRHLRMSGDLECARSLNTRWRRSNRSGPRSSRPGHGRRVCRRFGIVLARLSEAVDGQQLLTRRLAAAPPAMQPRASLRPGRALYGAVNPRDRVRNTCFARVRASLSRHRSEDLQRARKAGLERCANRPRRIVAAGRDRVRPRPAPRLRSGRIDRSPFIGPPAVRAGGLMVTAE